MRFILIAFSILCLVVLLVDLSPYCKGVCSVVVVVVVVARTAPRPAPSRIPSSYFTPSIVSSPLSPSSDSMLIHRQWNRLQRTLKGNINLQTQWLL
jgi:hypothetical protein